MFSHVMVGVSDIEASKKFYDAVLGALGIGRLGRSPQLTELRVRRAGRDVHFVGTVAPAGGDLP